MAEHEIPKIEPVVAPGEAVRKPKGVGRKLVESLIERDEGGSIIEKIIFQIIGPTIKDTIYNVFKDSIDMIFYGSTKPRTTGRTGGYTGYSSMSQSSAANRTPYRSTSNRIANDFDDITFPTKLAAENAVARMIERLEEYHRVSVGDFYDVANVSRNGYTDNNWGWTNLDGCYVTRRNGDWRVIMPKARQIDNV